jgi:hypothetical protein
MTVEQFESFLGDYAERLEDIGADLTPLVNDMVNDLKNAAPYKHGDLRRSIVGAVRGNDVEFGWLYYGSFQNYGVSGTKDSLGEIVNEAVSPFPRSGNTYKFKNRRYGLPAQEWFDVDDMTQLIVDKIAELTEQQNNNS